MRANLKTGVTYVFRGRVWLRKGDGWSWNSRRYLPPDSYQALAGSMQPVYGRTRGLSNKTIVRAQQMALEMRKMEQEYMPPDLRRRYELAEINYAMEHIHFPADQTELLFARKRLVFDEFFMFLVGVRRLKEHREDRHSAFMIKESEEVAAFQSSLPYAPYRSPGKGSEGSIWRYGKRSGDEPPDSGRCGKRKDHHSHSGPAGAAYNGYQGALMVPTEVLARQHFESMTGLFEKQGIERVPVLVTGSMTAKEKRLAYAKIASHEADIIIGNPCPDSGKGGVRQPCPGYYR